MKKAVFGFIAVFAYVLCLPSNVYAAGRLNLSSSNSSVTEGQTKSVQVTLDEPIIGPGPGAPYLHINFTSSDPTRATVNPNPVSYLGSEWFQAKTFTVNVLHDGVHNSSNTVTISYVIDSDSEYYNMYTGTFVLSITDIDPAPEPQPVTQAAAAEQPVVQATLAETGTSMTSLQLLLVATLLSSILGIAQIVRRFDRSA